MIDRRRPGSWLSDCFAMIDDDYYYTITCHVTWISNRNTLRALRTSIKIDALYRKNKIFVWKKFQVRSLGRFAITYTYAGRKHVKGVSINKCFLKKKNVWYFDFCSVTF